MNTVFEWSGSDHLQEAMDRAHEKIHWPHTYREFDKLVDKELDEMRRCAEKEFNERFINEMSQSSSRDDSTYDRCKRVLEAYEVFNYSFGAYIHCDLFIKALRMNGFDKYADILDNPPAHLKADMEDGHPYWYDRWCGDKARYIASNISTKMMLTKQWQKENLKFAFSKEGIAGTVLGVLVMSLSLYTSEIFLIIGIIIWIIGLSWHSLTHGGQD